MSGMVLPVYSEATGVTYRSADDLIAAESNGYVVVCIITSTKTGKPFMWPYVQGPFTDKAEAEKVRVKTRRKFKREDWRYPHQTYSFFVRPAWKDE